MSISFLGLAWWAITLIVLAAILATFFLCYGLIAIYLVIKGKKFNKLNQSCVKEENSVKPREETKEETIE